MNAIAVILCGPLLIQVIQALVIISLAIFLKLAIHTQEASWKKIKTLQLQDDLESGTSTVCIILIYKAIV